MKKKSYITPAGKVTLVQDKELTKALNILSSLSDEELDNQKEAIQVLNKFECYKAAALIEEMSSVEYEDFITNNLDYDDPEV